MGDSLRQDFITADFIAGEQPDHYKLTNIVSQLQLAANNLAAAIGDLFSQQTYSSTTGTYDIDLLPTVGPNLSRVIGSAGWLNPRHLGRISVADREVNFHAGTHNDTWEGFPVEKSRTFVLPYPPIIDSSAFGSETRLISYSYESSGTWSISAPDTGADASSTGTAKVVTRVDDLIDLNASGEYHVSEDGVITVYTSLLSGEGFKVTYTFSTLPDSYNGATLNIIPDFSQTAELCTVALVSGSAYEITVPFITHRRSYIGSYDAASYTRPSTQIPLETWTDTTQADPMEGTIAGLPLTLTSNLSNGDAIPSGYIQLFDSSSGEVLAGGTFTYVNSYIIRCTGLTLVEGNTRYRIIVPGTNLSATVSQLRESYHFHDHSGRVHLPDGGWTGDRVHHYDLSNLVDEGDILQHGFVSSAIGPLRHPHPQYLHRYGYQYNNDLADSENLHNALLGDLVIAGNDVWGRPILGGGAESYSIWFGGYDTDSSARIQYDNHLEISGDDLEVEMGLIVGDHINLGGNLFLDGFVQADGHIMIDDVSSEFVYLQDRTYYANINIEGGAPDPSSGWEYVTGAGHENLAGYITSTTQDDVITYPIPIPAGATFTTLEVMTDPNGNTLSVYVYYVDYDDWGTYTHPNENQINYSSSDSSVGTKITVPISSDGESEPFTKRFYVKLWPSSYSSGGVDVYGIRATFTMDVVAPLG